MHIFKMFLKAILIVLLFAAAVFATAAGGRLAKEMFSTGTLTLLNIPQSAQVYIDGGLNAGKISEGERLFTLTRGEHLLEITASGFQPYHNVINCGGQNSLKIELEKLRMTSFDITSQPPGAYVIIDGTIRGRTPLKLQLPSAPGYGIELTMANYFSRKDTVSANAEGKIDRNYKLENRQETAYRKRIEQNPRDIEAYNDLGELLFVQGRYEDSADIYVKGLSSIDTSRELSTNERHNINKIGNEAGNKHNDKGGVFRRAFDEKLLYAIESGSRSPEMINQLLRFGRSDRERYTKIIFELVKDDNIDPRIMVEALKKADNEKKTELLPKALRINYQTAQQYIAVVNSLNKTWADSNAEFKQQNSDNLQAFYRNINRRLKNNSEKEGTLRTLLNTYKAFSPKDYTSRMLDTVNVLPAKSELQLKMRLFVTRELSKNANYSKAVTETEKALADCVANKNLHNMQKMVETYLEGYKKSLERQKSKDKATTAKDAGKLPEGKISPSAKDNAKKEKDQK